MTPSPFQSSAGAPDGPFGPHTEAPEALNSEPTVTPSTDQQEKVDAAMVDRAVKLLTEILDDFDREMADDIEAEDFNIGQDEQIELPTESFRTLLTAFAAEREENERLRGELRRAQSRPRTLRELNDIVDRALSADTGSREG